MKHIYYKNDFAVEITLLNASGEVVSPPDWQWHIEFTDGRRKYICSVDKGNAKVVGNTIMCYLDNHKFCCGEIGYKFVQAIPDLNYLDGFQNLITPKALPIELWEQESDNDVNIQSSVVPAYVVYDAYMTAKANGYTGTEEEYYNALNHIVDINKKEAERVEAESNRVTAEQQRVENFVAMESALTTATNKANTATIAAEQSAERANTASDNADVATSNATQATKQATAATKRANDISADLEAKREADYWRGAKGDKGDKGDTGAKGDRGEKGDQGERGLQGVQGVKGDDGVSPTVTTSKTGKVTTIEITDANGVHTATVNDGESVEVVQSTGNSTTSVMSQKAVSDAINKLKNAGYLYAGIATPTTNPGTPDGPVFYIASQAGTYSNFGNTEIDSTGIFTWDGTSWSFEKLDFGGGSNIEIINDLTTGGEWNALSAEMGKVLNEKIENNGDDVYMVTSSSLADAVAEVPLDDRKVGLVIGLPCEGSSIRRYKYMGKYYTDVDWFSEGAWLDLDNADKYNVYYFRLCPTIEGHVDNASINSSGEVTTGTKHVTDYIAIPESGVSIGGGFYSRYTLYDSSKNKVSTNLLYGGKAFIYSTTESAFIRLEYETNTPVWLFGYAPGSSSAAAPSLPHVEVIEDFDNLIDYDDNTWAGNVGPFIRLRKGETINLLMRGTDTVATDPYYMSVQAYNISQEAYGSVKSTARKYVMPIDGYVKIGYGAQPALKNARYNIISKSIARTRAKKRLLVVGDSISVFTWDNTQSKDVIQGYPFFLATQGDHELSVTNQAVSGKESSSQLTTLQNKDVSVYDAVTIFIGTNDYGYNTSIATFKSNIAAMVDYITAQNPACKIGFLTLIHRASAWDGTAEVPNAAGAVLSDYCTAIKEVAMTYGLPVLDLWNECQCNFNFSIYKTNYSSHKSEASGDGLHPTNEAHKLFLYPLVREFVKKLL